MSRRRKVVGAGLVIVSAIALVLTVPGKPSSPGAYCARADVACATEHVTPTTKGR